MHGLTAWQRLYKRYNPETVARAIRPVRAVAHPPKVKELKRVEAVLDKWEEQGTFERYSWRLSGSGIVTAMLRESIQESVYSSLGIAVEYDTVSRLVSNKVAMADGPTPMDVDRVTVDCSKVQMEHADDDQEIGGVNISIQFHSRRAGEHREQGSGKWRPEFGQQNRWVRQRRHGERLFFLAGVSSVGRLDTASRTAPRLAPSIGCADVPRRVCVVARTQRTELSSHAHPRMAARCRHFRKRKLQCCEADVWPKGRLAGKNAKVLPKKAGVGIFPRTARPSSTTDRGTFVSVEFDQTRVFTGRGEPRVLCRPHRKKLRRDVCAGRRRTGSRWSQRTRPRTVPVR